MANRKDNFGGAADSARGAESGIDHAGIAIGIIGSGMSHDQKIKALSDHPTMPHDIKTKAIDQVVRAAGGGITAAPGANTPENRPSVKSGEVKPMSIEEALREQASSKRQAAKSGSSDFSTSERRRVQRATSSTRGVDVRQTIPSRDFHVKAQGVHTQLQNVVTSLKNHVSNLAEHTSLESAQESISNAGQNLAVAKPLLRGRIEGNRVINLEPQANSHLQKATAHLHSAHDFLNEPHIAEMAKRAKVSAELPVDGLNELSEHSKTLQIVKPAKSFSRMAVGDRQIPTSEIRNKKSMYNTGDKTNSIKDKIIEVGGKETPLAKRIAAAESGTPRKGKSARRLRGSSVSEANITAVGKESEATTGIDRSVDPRVKASKTKRLDVRYSGGTAGGKTPTFEGSVGGKKLTSKDIKKIKADPKNSALKPDPAKKDPNQNRGNKGGAT
jgi:hypothetical protein